MKIDYGQFIHALSDTVDLVGVDELQHGKRVAFMALECADLMGVSRERKSFLYRAGLLHDCGVSTTKVHKNLVNELEWQESDLHCQIGAERVLQFTPLAQFAETIRYHHTRWEDLQELPIPETIKMDANLIFLLDRVDALAGMTGNSNRLAVCDTICNKITNLRDSYFQPDLVDVFLEAADKEAFWISQEPHYLAEYLQKIKKDTEEIYLDTGELKDMAKIFAQIVDAKSPFTAEHSFGVARVADYLGKRCQLPENLRTKIEVAALLHDLGKLLVPDPILDYDGGLEGESLAIMRHHSYVTYIILNRIKGLEEISLWASSHHENLDGSGYPFRKAASELSIESRIIMAADIFQALAQDRPYRSQLPQDDIVSILEEQANAGKLDRELINIIKKETDECYREAVGNNEG